MSVLTYPMAAWQILLGDIAGSAIHPTQRSYDAAHASIDHATNELRRLLPKLSDNIHSPIIEDSSSVNRHSESSRRLILVIDCTGLPVCTKKEYIRRLNETTDLKPQKQEMEDKPNLIIMAGPEIKRYYQCYEFGTNLACIRGNEVAPSKYDKIIRIAEHNVAEINEINRLIEVARPNNVISVEDMAAMQEKLKNKLPLGVTINTSQHSAGRE